jgi:hypothetical protein
MLNPCRYYFAFFGISSQRSFYGGIITFGAACGEYDFGRLTAEQCRDLFTCLTYFDADLPAEGMHTRRVAVKLAKIRLDFLENLFGDFGCGVVIEIYCFHCLSPPCLAGIFNFFNA